MTDREFKARLEIWSDRAAKLSARVSRLTFGEAMIFVALMELEDTQRRALHKKMLEGKAP